MDGFSRDLWRECETAGEEMDNGDGEEKSAEDGSDGEAILRIHAMTSSATKWRQKRVAAERRVDTETLNFTFKTPSKSLNRECTRMQRGNGDKVNDEGGWKSWRDRLNCLSSRKWKQSIAKDFN
jgi:hypothetical protein